MKDTQKNHTPLDEAMFAQRYAMTKLRAIKMMCVEMVLVSSVMVLLATLRFLGKIGPDVAIALSIATLVYLVVAFKRYKTHQRAFKRAVAHAKRQLNQVQR